MCWLSGSLTCRLPNVMRSPPARRSLVSSITVDWCLAPRRWGLYLKSRSTNYPDHGHHGDPPPKRKIPMVKPGIEPGTSWLVVRSSDHYTTRLVAKPTCAKFSFAEKRSDTPQQQPDHLYEGTGLAMIRFHTEGILFFPSQIPTGCFLLKGN